MWATMRSSDVAHIVSPLMVRALLPYSELSLTRFTLTRDWLFHLPHRLDPEVRDSLGSRR